MAIQFSPEIRDSLLKEADRLESEAATIRQFVATGNVPEGQVSTAGTPVKKGGMSDEQKKALSKKMKKIAAKKKAEKEAAAALHLGENATPAEMGASSSVPMTPEEVASGGFSVDAFPKGIPLAPSSAVSEPESESGDVGGPVSSTPTE